MFSALAIPGWFAILWFAYSVSDLLVSSLDENTAIEAVDEADEPVRAVKNTIALPRDVTQNQQGLYELVTLRLTLITDIPMDDELRSWPGLIEQSLVQWQGYFGVDVKRMDGFHVTAMLIKDRERLTTLGLLENVPGFDEGYQFGNKIYLREQPTVYFRRLLFLHEATHWIMWKLYGGGGSPWFMEGMAEMQGTHLLTNGLLKLRVIPTSRELVSGWGRLRLIDETLKREEAPSLSHILAYGNQREDHVVRYAWSWAACVFFSNHPRYGPILRDLYSNKLDYSDSLSIRFKKRIEADWTDVQVDWNAFVSDLDFGYDLQRSSVVSDSSHAKKRLNDRVVLNFPLATDRGWQPTGIMVEAGIPVRISCTGNYILRKSTSPSDANWVVEPQGITYQFYRGNPLGCVLASVVSGEGTEQTKRWDTLRVGSEVVIDPPKDGELFLKINEPSNGLWDNSGNVSVQISVARN